VIQLVLQVEVVDFGFEKSGVISDKKGKVDNFEQTYFKMVDN
jgi:hypothetical protein